jgi:hypothetical protein
MRRMGIIQRNFSANYFSGDFTRRTSGPESVGMQEKPGANCSTWSIPGSGIGVFRPEIRGVPAVDLSTGQIVPRGTICGEWEPFGEACCKSLIPFRK